MNNPPCYRRDDVVLYKGDCLDLLPLLYGSNISMVLTDPPYGTTAHKWDSVIPLEALWPMLLRCTSKPAAFVFTASQPFTTTLIASNLTMFKYCWVWEKDNGTMPMNAPYQPLKVHEDIVVFSQKAATYSKKGTMNYKPQMWESKPYGGSQRKSGLMAFHTLPEAKGYVFKGSTGQRYPRSVLAFNTERGLHPTQKPVALMEYLIKTYTDEGDTVLDFAAGSGTAGIAAINTNRKCILIEKDPEYCVSAAKRLEVALNEKN